MDKINIRIPVAKYSIEMLYYGVFLNSPKRNKTGKEAVHDLESLVGTRV